MRPKIDIFILVVVGVVFLNSLLWIFSLPFNGAPDEYDHYRLAAFIADHGRIPVLAQDQDFYFSSIATHFPVTPKLIAYHEQNAHTLKNTFLYELKPVYMMWPCGPYLGFGLAMAIGKAFAGVPLFYFGRFFSALCAVLIVFFAYDISRKLRPQDLLFQKLTTLFVAFLPQFTFLSAYINPDIVTTLVATIIFRLWFYAVDTRGSVRSAAALGVALGLGILSKISGYSVIVASLLFLLFSLPREKRLRFFVVLGAFGVLTSGWFFVRNFFLYHDVFGYAAYTNRLQQFLAQAPAFLVQHDVFSFLNQAGYRWSFSYLVYFCYSSFWGVFGWMTIPLPSVFYFVGGGLLGVGMVGAIVGCWQKKINFPAHMFWSFLAAIALQIASIIFYVGMIKYQPQGRYLYPSIIALAAVVSLGLLTLPARGSQKRSVVLAVSFFMIGLNIFSFLYCHALRYFLAFA